MGAAHKRRSTIVMRKTLGPLLLGVGGFLLTTALLVLLWVPGQVKKTPLNVNSLTQLAGEASYLGSDRAPVKATSKTVTDGDASTGDAAVFSTFTCLMWNPDGKTPDCVSGEGENSRLINAGTDNFATDRKTALAFNDQEKYVGANASPHQGLINKFPFDVEKKTYPFWDGILNRAVDAAFVGEENVNGLKTYRFNINVVDEPAEIASGLQGKYSDDKTMWIDPMTGSIIKQVEKQVRMLPDGSAALDLDLAFTDDQVAANVKDAEENGGRLGLIGRLPWIVGLLGLLSLAGGLLLGRGRENEQRVATTATKPAATTATKAASPASASGATATATTARSGAEEPTRPLFGATSPASSSAEATVRRGAADLPEGAVRLPDGTVRLADGTIRRPGIDLTKE